MLLSHNGMDVDLKLASRITGVDIILGGHTHDGMPQPSVIGNRGGKTLVTNAGSNGKFLAVVDLELRDGRLADYRYRLLPVFSACCRRMRTCRHISTRCARRTAKNSPRPWP
ncbi:MAG: hypothetical protein WDN04_11000 [Rhodospirillales bacterium]